MSTDWNDGAVPGDDWVEEKRRYQPRALLFRMLAILWIFPSLGAVWIIGAGGVRWLSAETLVDGLRMVTVEQWLAMVLLLSHPLFVVLAIRFRRTEPFKEETVLLPKLETKDKLRNDSSIRIQS